MRYVIASFKYSIVFLFLFFLVVIFYGKVPLIEGDKTITEGKIANFTVGATKEETFEAIKTHYSKKGYILKTSWGKSESFSNELVQFETASFNAGRNNERFSEFATEITELTYMVSPFVRTTEWKIEVPSSYINSIYLKFSDGKLYEITRSRWLFERP